MRRRLTVLLVTGMASCSYLFMETRPPDWRPPAPLHCSTTRGWAAWDLLATLTGVGSSAGAFALAARESEHTDAFFLFGLLALVTSFPEGVSAGRGFQEARRCEEARRLQPLAPVTSAPAASTPE